MLKETIRRPFLCLRKELHCRMEWRIIIICLVSSPAMFMEMRSLFHFWFLETGLGSLLQLHSAVVSSVLDILLKPVSWGISIELGQTLPFSRAYFPSQQSDLLAILTGPLSCKSFMGLVRYINALTHLGKSRTCFSSQKMKNLQLQPSTGLVKENASWSMMMSFPAWFSFATTLLFYREGSQDYLSETLSKEIIAESISDISLAQSAAFYLAWVLCPSNDQCQMLANNILDLSHSWARNNKICPSYDTSIVNHRRKLRIPSGDSQKFNVTTNSVSSLIKEFDESCVKFCCVTAAPLMQAEALSGIRPSCQNLLHLWIPLGVLLVSTSWVNEQCCDMLLHYTSMGHVLEANEVQRKTNDRVSNDGFSASGGAMVERWALSGLYLIFGWLDVVEDMLSGIFDSEDTCHRFVSQLQTKIGPYLLRCVVSLLEEPNEGDQDTDFAIDLHDRLLYWSKNEQSCKEFEGVILQMKKKFNLPL